MKDSIGCVARGLYNEGSAYNKWTPLVQLSACLVLLRKLEPCVIVRLDSSICCEKKKTRSLIKRNGARIKEGSVGTTTTSLVLNRVASDMVDNRLISGLCVA